MPDLGLLGLAAGSRGRFTVFVLDRRQRTTRKGAPYADLVIGDSAGRVRAFKWNLTDSEWAVLDSERFLIVEGPMREDLDKNSESGKAFHIESFQATTVENPANFLPAPRADWAARWDRLRELVREVSDPDLRRLLKALFSDEDFRDRYVRAPAAQARHHAYLGGLLDHSVEVAELCVAACDRMSHLNRGLLITGALLHDVGKLREIACDQPGYEFTPEGGLLGHVTLGADLVSERIAGLEGFPETTRQALLHLILSHHGRKEWGAPVEPCTPEALLLHACDLISAQMFYCAEARRQAGNHPFVWVNALERRIFLGERNSCNETPREDAPDNPFTDDIFSVSALTGPEPADATPASWEGMTLLPIYGCIAAGPAIRVEQNLEGFRAVPIVPEGAEDFFLKVSGESMRDAHILDGDLVRVRPGALVREGDIVAALVDGDATVKRFHRDGDGVVLKAENPDFEDIPVGGAAELAIQGVVVGLVRDAIL